MKSTSTLSVLCGVAFLFFTCSEERHIADVGNLVTKTVDQDPGLPSITVNGAKLHAQAFGPPDSTMIVFLHGGPGRDHRYLLNGMDLANHGYRVVFFDQRGSGLSQRFSRSSYTSLGKEVLNVFYDEISGVIAHYRTHPEQKVFLFGLSWGGILATGFAGRHPTAIQGLAVGEPGGLIWDDIWDYSKESQSFGFTSELLTNVSYLDQFITGKEDQHAILDYKRALQAADNDITGEVNTKPNSFWRSGAVIQDALIEIGKDHEPDFSEGIEGFNIPVLFFYSEHNKAYPDSWAIKISSAYNTVERVKVPGVGHTGIIFDKTSWTNVTLPRLLTYFNSL